MAGIPYRPFEVCPCFLCFRCCCDKDPTLKELKEKHGCLNAEDGTCDCDPKDVEEHILRVARAAKEVDRA